MRMLLTSIFQPLLLALGGLMRELSGNLAICVHGDFELNLHHQNHSAIANHIVVSRHDAGERSLAVGAESGCPTTYETILLACYQVRPFDALPIRVGSTMKTAFRVGHGCGIHMQCAIELDGLVDITADVCNS